jgi:predicted acylesterase/phospholipase RssA
MRRRPQEVSKPSISFTKPISSEVGEIGLVLSGGGSRAAYQVGALRALEPLLQKSKHPISVVVGSSIGAVNGLVFSACLKSGLTQTVDQLTEMWRERTFRNTFRGSPSQAFFRAIRMAARQYAAPGPSATSSAVFDPSPLMERVDQVIRDHGGLAPEDRAPTLTAVAVMTTQEGSERKPLLFLSSHKTIETELMTGASFDVCHVKGLSAKHGFASAALPSVLPPVELDTDIGKVKLVDGGISQNIPVDPAVRLGARRVLVIDISGRNYWLDRYNESHDTRPTWEVPAGLETFCLRPPDTFVVRCQQPLGPLLKQCVGSSRSKFISAVGPIWPLFTLLRNKLGEEVAYEAMSYVALDADYNAALIERGYNEARFLLRNKAKLEFERNESYAKLVKAV